MARNLNGTADAPSARGSTASPASARLCAARELAQYNNVQAWATSIWANHDRLQTIDDLPAAGRPATDGSRSARAASRRAQVRADFGLAGAAFLDTGLSARWATGWPSTHRGVQAALTAADGKCR
jgi:hypothetical protein